MATREDSRRYLENWQDEIDSAAEYRASAACKAKPSSTSKFADLANSAISGQLKVASIGGHRAAVKNVIRADDESCPI